MSDPADQAGRRAHGRPSAGYQEAPAFAGRAQEFIAAGGDEYPILRDCIADGGAAGLAATQMLAEDMYGGITFNYEIKAPAAFALIAFGQMGLHALVEMARRTPTSKNVSLCLSILSSVAAGSPPRLLASFTRDDKIRAAVDAASAATGLADVARSQLREYVLGIEDDLDAVQAVGTQLSRVGWTEEDPAIAGELFAALAARRLAIGPVTIQAFERLIREHPDDEPIFHSFFERHPQLLDPAAVEVWSKPDLVGAREPDFVLRRMDDSYLVVEIETPGKTLMTESNQLSAMATRAIAQVTDYRAFLVERFSMAAAYFPRFSEPDCLVIIGTEEQLSPSQREALARDNGSRARLRVAGFDWVARRASVISRNVVETRLTVQSIRVI